MVQHTETSWREALAEWQGRCRINYREARKLYAKRNRAAEVYQRVAANKWLRTRGLIDETYGYKSTSE